MTEINFENTKVAFQIKKNKELNWAYLMFRLISMPLLVRFGNNVIAFMTRISLPVKWIVKPTVYKQFVGGENIGECAEVVERLALGGVKSILDYSVEGRESDEEIEVVLKETMAAIGFAAKNQNIPFAVFKPTAFIKSGALEELSVDENNSGEDSKKEAEKFRKRVDILCATAFKYDLPILIDAEDSWYQNFIDKVVYEMQKKYNGSQSIVFNTYQMYRHDRLGKLKNDIERARKENFFIGVKFVRGAYMERERARAAEMNYPDPIQLNKEATDADFNEALRISIRNLDVLSVFNGTHNEESSKWMIKLMEENSIQPNDQRCWFSQLFGMSDHISFNLAASQYNVAKYLPYGPVKHVLPYLTRRAEENTSVKGQTGRELRLLKLERQRRKDFKDGL